VRPLRRGKMKKATSSQVPVVLVAAGQVSPSTSRPAAKVRGPVVAQRDPQLSPHGGTSAVGANDHSCVHDLVAQDSSVSDRRSPARGDLHSAYTANDLRPALGGCLRQLGRRLDD
jgi:hypothetical protein